MIVGKKPHKLNVEPGAFYHVDWEKFCQDAELLTDDEWADDDAGLHPCVLLQGRVEYNGERGEWRNKAALDVLRGARPSRVLLEWSKLEKMAAKSILTCARDNEVAEALLLGLERKE